MIRCYIFTFNLYVTSYHFYDFNVLIFIITITLCRRVCKPKSLSGLVATNVVVMTLLMSLSCLVAVQRCTSLPHCRVTVPREIQFHRDIVSRHIAAETTKARFFSLTLQL
jgi:hypothetical protein